MVGLGNAAGTKGIAMTNTKAAAAAAVAANKASKGETSNLKEKIASKGSAAKAGKAAAGSGGSGKAAAGSTAKKGTTKVKPSEPGGSGLLAAAKSKSKEAEADPAAAAAAAEAAAAAAKAEAAKATAATQLQAVERGRATRAVAATKAKTNGKVVVRYNHYDKQYVVIDGKLNWEHVDDQYAISFVFKGDWTCHLVGWTGGAKGHATDEKVLPDGGALHKEMRKDPDAFDPDGQAHAPLTPRACACHHPPPRACAHGSASPCPVRSHAWTEEEEKWCGFFSGLSVVDADGQPREYRLEVQEDAVWEAAQGPRKTYKAPDAEVKVKKMESCSCIEGNPCVDAYCCKDWKNRFEVAKKNGWKGFS